MMRRAGPLLGGAALVAFLLGLVMCVANPAPVTHRNTIAGPGMGITSHAEVRQG